MSRTLSICASCGASRPDATRPCVVCDAAGPTPSSVALVDGDLVWVTALASATCRDCGERSSIGAFEPDCAFVCARCGRRQLLEPDTFGEAMAMAWEIADHALDPFPLDDRTSIRSDLGALRASATQNVLVTFASEGISPGSVVRSRSMRQQFALGRPLCEACHAPLATRLEDETLIARCEPCDRSTEYGRPADPHGIRVRPVAILDATLRPDVSPAKVESTGGIVALRCPTCSASLASVDERGLARCEFCKDIALVDVSFRAGLGAQACTDRSDVPTWLAFRGPSPTRRARVAAAERKERAAKRRVDADGDELPPISPEVARQRNVAAAVAAVFCVGLLGLLLATSGNDAAPAVAATTPSNAATSTAAPSAPAPTPAPELPEACGCPAEGDAPAIRWTVTVNSVMQLGADLTIDVAYGWRVDGQDVPLLASTSTAPPDPIRVRRLELGVACVGDTMLVADGTRLSAWSRSARRITASVAADSAFGPLPEPAGPQVDCIRATFADGAISFADAGGFDHRIVVPAGFVRDPPGSTASP